MLAGIRSLHRTTRAEGQAPTGSGDVQLDSVFARHAALELARQAVACRDNRLGCRSKCAREEECSRTQMEGAWKVLDDPGAVVHGSSRPERTSPRPAACAGDRASTTRKEVGAWFRRLARAPTLIHGRACAAKIESSSPFSHAMIAWLSSADTFSLLATMKSFLPGTTSITLVPFRSVTT